MDKANWVSLLFSSVLFFPFSSSPIAPTHLFSSRGTAIVDDRLVLLVLRADVQFLLDLIRELLLSAAVLANTRGTRGTSGGGSMRGRGLDMVSWGASDSACSAGCSNIWCKAVVVGVLVSAIDGVISHSGGGVLGRDSRSAIVLSWRNRARGDGGWTIEMGLGARSLVVSGVEAGSRLCT